MCLQSRVTTTGLNPEGAVDLPPSLASHLVTGTWLVARVPPEVAIAWALSPSWVRSSPLSGLQVWEAWGLLNSRLCSLSSGERSGDPSHRALPPLLSPSGQSQAGVSLLFPQFICLTQLPFPISPPPPHLSLCQIPACAFLLWLGQAIIGLCAALFQRHSLGGVLWAHGMHVGGNAWEQHSYGKWQILCSVGLVWSLSLPPPFGLMNICLVGGNGLGGIVGLLQPGDNTRAQVCSCVCVLVI